MQPLDYQPSDLIRLPNGQRLREVAYHPYQEMVAAAKSDGITLTAESGFRDFGYQKQIFESQVRNRGEAHALESSAKAGYSEHQTGLVMDIYGPSTPGCRLAKCFEDSAEYEWLTEHAADFGFIQRFHEGSQEITGYKPESWHFRYVGKELASYMKKHGINTLEEVFNVQGGDY